MKKLETSMYEASIGITEDADRTSHEDVNQKSSITSAMKKDSKNVDPADNLESWRFAMMKDPIMNLLNSERVNLDRTSKRFISLRKLYKSGIQETSIEEDLLQLVHRMIYVAVENSIVVPSEENKSDGSSNGNNNNNSNNNMVLQNDGRTTTLRFFPSLKRRLSIASFVWKEVVMIFRQDLLELGAVLAGQTSIEPGKTIQRLTLLDSLVPTKGKKRRRKKEERSERGEDDEEVSLDEEDDDDDLTILRGDVVDQIVDHVLETTFHSMVSCLENAFVPDSRMSLWCRTEVVRHAASVLWSLHLPCLRSELWNDVDQRYLSPAPPFVLDDTFANYFDRMGIVLANDNDVYGQKKKSQRKRRGGGEKETEKEKERVGEEKGGQRTTSSSLQRIENRDRPHWRYLLSFFHTTRTKLTSFGDQYRSTFIPVVTFTYLESTTSNSSSVTSCCYSPSLLFVCLTRYLSCLQLFLLVVLPFTSAFLPTHHEQAVMTLTLGFSLDLRSPQLILIIASVSSAIVLISFMSVVVSLWSLYELRSPLSRTTFVMIGSLECAQVHKDSRRMTSIKRRQSGLLQRTMFALCPKMLDGSGTASTYKYSCIVRGGTFRREPSNKKIGFIYTRYTPFIGVFVESDSLRIMRISLIVMLGASLFSAAFAE